MFARRSWIVLIAALALTLVLAACGDDGEETAGPTVVPEATTVRGSGNIATLEIGFAGQCRTPESAAARTTRHRLFSPETHDRKMI